MWNFELFEEKQKQKKKAKNKKQKQKKQRVLEPFLTTYWQHLESHFCSQNNCLMRTERLDWILVFRLLSLLSFSVPKVIAVQYVSPG